jgi:hypothetical protein
MGSGVPLLMPELGAAVEPTRTAEPTPWWRAPSSAPLPAPEHDVAPDLTPDAPVAWPLD